MAKGMKNLLSLALLIICGMAARAQATRPMAQYPSPMAEYTRSHKRIPPGPYPGYHFSISGLLPRPVSVYVPLKTAEQAAADLLVHFHGRENVVDYAAEHYPGRLIAVAVNLGAGSSAYEKPFLDTTLFQKLLDSVEVVLRDSLGHAIGFRDIIVSGFSAGYGAVRALLEQKSNRRQIDAVLLLDGLHASYVPERQVLAEGGRVDSSAYVGFLRFCRLAVNAQAGKKFLFTHSELFPGTFVSTTESAHYLLTRLKVRVHPVLKWGPMGMQQISEARKNNFWVLGFAGNTAPDHIDHLQSLSYFLNRLNPK